jgi:zinc transport system substrate-binding protein
VRARQAAFLGTVVVLLLLSAGWAYLAVPTGGAGDGRLHAVATFYPLYYFASEIGGERARVDALMPFNSEPHAWEPRISDIVNVDKARVFIYNGAGLEPWVDRFLGTLQHREMLEVVDATSGLPLQRADPGTTDEHGGPDPHVWLDPILAAEQVELVRRAFCEADPGGSDHYNGTAAGLAGRLAAVPL